MHVLMRAGGRGVHSAKVSTTVFNPTASAPPRSWQLIQAGLTLIAAAGFVVRGVLTATGTGFSDNASRTTGVGLASLAALLAFAAAALALRSPRAAALPLAGALALELTVLGNYVAPPRLITALPLFAALALAVVRPMPDVQDRREGIAPSPGRTAAAAVALTLMVPVGFMYLTTGLVAPAPDVFGVYALFAALVVVAVRLAQRRSLWVLAVPAASAALWFLVLLAGGELLDWSP